MEPHPSDVTANYSSRPKADGCKLFWSSFRHCVISHIVRVVVPTTTLLPVRLGNPHDTALSRVKLGSQHDTALSPEG